MEHVPIARAASVGDPLYLQLAAKLRDYIATEKLMPGDLIPPEPALAKRFGVGRITLRRAVGILTHEGLLVRSQGIGTFVAAPRLSEPLIGLHSTREIVRAHNLEHSVRIVRMGKARATAEEADQLGLAQGEPVVRLTRLDSVGGSPLAVAQDILPYQLFHDITRDELERSSTYELIEQKFNIFLTSARQSIRAGAAPAEIARLLEVPTGSPVLILERVTFASDGRTVEVGTVSYRHDRMEWTIELFRQLGGQEESQGAIVLRYQPRESRDS